MSKIKSYPICACGASMTPIWFIEKERDGNNILTGRTRKACSHFECTACCKNECVDDTFDEPWQ